MISHPLSRRRYLVHRQNGLNSQGDGIDQSSSLVIDPSSAGIGATSLDFDTHATGSASRTASVPLADSVTPIVSTPTTSSSSSSTVDPSPSSSSNPTTSPGGLSTSAVVVGCIAALIGTILLILVGICLYKRYMRSLKKSYANAASEASRRRSRQAGPWTKLRDDKQDGIQMKEADADGHMDKMFKKAPSVRTAYTHKSEEPMNIRIPQSLAQYHPELAKRNASSEAVTMHRPFIARQDSGPTISWDADTLQGDAVTSQKLTSTPTGNSGSIAIPTPIATRNLHRWQSAEVINPDSDAATTASNPFETDSERRKSSSNHNPFFKGQDIHVRARSSSVTSGHTIKGKERALKAESFASDITALPNPPTLHQIPSGSSSSAMNNTRAIQTLIAALDVTEQDIQDRLRVVSMQPSIMTTVTTDSASTGDLALATSFPLPPSRDDGHVVHHQ